MTQARKLIEVAMPVKEISAESVRDKSIRHGHISTLHLWWARRPLPVCRAVVFASLVPDPLDERCPPVFRDAVELLLGPRGGSDTYKPYEDIPYTAAADPLEDNLRNRLLMFIGKFSETYIENERRGRATPAREQLGQASLIKWDNRHDEEVIGRARRLIWVAHNARDGARASELLADFDRHYASIRSAEGELYDTPDRHLGSEDVMRKEAALRDAVEAFLDRMPRVFDPFAGGGAIPLEAARLGCRSYGNDINPVAHIIQKGSLEFPQKYGKPIVYSRDEFVRRYGEAQYTRFAADKPDCAAGGRVKVLNRLAFDVEFYARELLRRAEAEVGHLYPADEHGARPIAYYWARVGTCGNPRCRAEVPLLKGFYLSKRRKTAESAWFHLKPLVEGKRIDFAVGRGKFEGAGWLTGRALLCPCCNNSTPIAAVKEQAAGAGLGERLVAVIGGSDRGKTFRAPTRAESQASVIDESLLDPRLIPCERMPRIPDLVSGRGWGVERWSQLFSTRQLLTLQTLVRKLDGLKPEIGVEEDYGKAVISYLAILIDRVVARCNSFVRWHTQQDTIEHPFGRQAIPMMFDYPEMNPFAGFSGGAFGQLESVVAVIEENGKDLFPSFLSRASSDDKEQFPAKSLTAVVTDPPYFDAIAYADLSDFFYVWLKRTLGDVYPANFDAPQTPRADECTALRHQHAGDAAKAANHFGSKLLQILDAIERQTSGVVSIMFAHQSTEAWATLCDSILGARMNVTGSWAINTEMAVRMVSIGNAALQSSVTVSCKPSSREGLGEYYRVRKAVERKVGEEVAGLYALGFRGADLLTACFGKAVSEFGRYERVEKAPGEEVTVAELLEMTRESAFNALLKGFEGDDFTRFYIGWLELYGFGEGDFDAASKLARVVHSFNAADLFARELLVRNGERLSLADCAHRAAAVRRLGEERNSPLIDQAHRAMSLYERGDRRALLDLIGRFAASPEVPFWRVLTSLGELLPKGTDDRKQAARLLENKDTLIRECRASRAAAAAE